MTSLDHLEAQFGSTRSRSSLMTRLSAFLHGPSLDSDLAAGIRPSATPAHLARADQITSSHARRRVRAALKRAVVAANGPRRKTVHAPLNRPGIRACGDALSRLADSIVTANNPRVQAVAIARQLAFDGTGALFFQPNKTRSVSRLRNTIQAAQSALTVSGDFDRPRREIPV